MQAQLRALLLLNQLAPLLLGPCSQAANGIYFAMQ
jgi:hypothetical protein